MKIFKKLLVVFLTLLLCSSCANTKHYTAYTVYPIGYLINRIGGDKVESISVQTNNLVQISTINPTYKEILNDSMYFFHVGDLEPYMDLYNKEIDETEVEDIDLSVLNAIYDFKRYSLVYVNGLPNFIEQPYYDGEVFNEIDTYRSDMFLWLDLTGMLSMAKTIYQTLKNNYVEQASYFTENYESLVNDLTSLDASYQILANRLKKENKTIKFVSMTASFGSWQKAYGFQVYPICLSKYGSLPNEKQLEIIKRRIIDDEVKYIAYEPNMSEDMEILYEQLKNELGLKRVNISNISSLTSSQMDDGKDYLSLMKDNLSVLESIADE